MNSEGYENLANAVVLQAARDYRKALKNRDAHEIKKLEDFFRSDHYSMFTDVDGEYLVQRLQAEYREWVKNQKKKKEAANNVCFV